MIARLNSRTTSRRLHGRKQRRPKSINEGRTGRMMTQRCGVKMEYLSTADGEAEETSVDAAGVIEEGEEDGKTTMEVMRIKYRMLLLLCQKLD